jgi:hypothetical protein
MRIEHFDAPGNVDDFGNEATLKAKWSRAMSKNFDDGVNRVTAFLSARGAGTCQFYNPVTHGRAEPDMPLADISWNGFPKKMGSAGTGSLPRYAEAEPRIQPGQSRPQDEYLEWHVVRNAAKKITSIQFTCEGYDYWEFLAAEAPDKLLALYRKFISPTAQMSELMFSGGGYNRLNPWNTRDGAMHLTERANNLFAEVTLAAEATVRRRDANGAAIVAPVPLTRCAGFGDEKRNSDPAIGAGVNGLVRQDRMITLANPVGLYMDHIDTSGFRLPDGSSASGFFKILRGTAGRTLRAVYELPPDLAAAGLTVSDVKIGGVPIQFGGQIAEKITMKLTGVASAAQTFNSTPVGCGQIPQTGGGGLGLADAGVRLPRRAS